MEDVLAPAAKLLYQSTRDDRRREVQSSCLKVPRQVYSWQILGWWWRYAVCSESKVVHEARQQWKPAGANESSGDDQLYASYLQELNSKEHEQSDKDADGSSVESGKNDVGDCQLEYDSESSVDDDIVDIEDEDEDNEAEFLHDNEALEDFVEQIGNTSTASGSNQLPQGFYSTVNFNIHTAAFVGMFGADGVNASAYYLTGLSCFSLLISVSSSGRRIRAVSLVSHCLGGTQWWY